MRPLDHVTVAGPDLAALRAAFEGCGFESEFGGEHDNGVTHMAVVGFGDRTYVELIAKHAAGTSPWWDAEIDGAAGPAAWAIPTDDIAAETDRLADAGFEVSGPDAYARERPDGAVARWELTAVGDRLGTPLPMLIEDRTPLERRVPVTDPEPLSGVRTVVVASADGSLVEPFERLFDAAAGRAWTDPSFGARVTPIEGGPVAVAEPLGTDGWLHERLGRFGPGPCGFLFGTADPEFGDALSVRGTAPWGDRRVAWLDIALPGRYGVLLNRRA